MQILNVPTHLMNKAGYTRFFPFSPINVDELISSDEPDLQLVRTGFIIMNIAGIIWVHFHYSFLLLLFVCFCFLSLLTVSPDIILCGWLGSKRQLTSQVVVLGRFHSYILCLRQSVLSFCLQVHMVCISFIWRNACFCILRCAVLSIYS